MENNEFKKVCIKNCMCYYFDDIIKVVLSPSKKRYMFYLI